MEKKQLVVFDIEGILIPKNRYLLFEISRKVGFFGFIRIIIFGLLYEIGVMSLESALKRIFLMFKGFKSNECSYKTGLSAAGGSRSIPPLCFDK